MKRKFSTKWIGSKQGRKQRKYVANAPLHIKHDLMSTNLAKPLRQKYGRRNFPARKGDTVKIMRGKFKGKQGKINNVDLRRMKASIEGIQIQKKDGTKVEVYLSPSIMQIQDLVLEDKKRKKAIEKKDKTEEKKEKKQEKENASQKK